MIENPIMPHSITVIACCHAGIRQGQAVTVNGRINLP